MSQAHEKGHYRELGIPLESEIQADLNTQFVNATPQDLAKDARAKGLPPKEALLEAAKAIQNSMTPPQEEPIR
jgi:hypothetical protein